MNKVRDTANHSDDLLYVLHYLRNTSSYNFTQGGIPFPNRMKARLKQNQASQSCLEKYEQLLLKNHR
jgi:hypothetical protein